MEDTITISKSELQELIAKEIANRTHKTRRDFGNIQIQPIEIEGVNRLYPEIFNRLRLPFYNNYTDDVMPLKDTGRFDSNIGYTNTIYSKTRHFKNNAYHHSKGSLYSTTIHEILKSLTLALHGATLIKDLDDEEF